jgi:hypothetical protein
MSTKDNQKRNFTWHYVSKNIGIRELLKNPSKACSMKEKEFSYFNALLAADHA